MKLLLFLSALSIVLYGFVYGNPPGINTVKAAIKLHNWLAPCRDPPNTYIYGSRNECSRKCSGHCATCNSTCIFGKRCVCGTDTYCMVDMDLTVVAPGEPLRQKCYPVSQLI
ncbi:uncharacterized protein LOC116803532 [Drosophila sechellia]|uniref:uncharacterized protein LOC116803532 n=1 Tax=Drosophila sechellia TaxID=7238 RepID=UPI0013DDF48B|nr:uncharacterized protein LOC116803532 [Drosophila sechellia]